jgi:hypothetical protein
VVIVMVTVEVSCDNVVDLVLLKALMDERRMFCEGSGNISCDNCDGDGKRGCSRVMVTVMLVVVSVHHQVMSDVRTVTETEMLVQIVVVTEQQIVMNYLNFYNFNKTYMSITIIAAVGENNAIGKDNKLLWHLPMILKGSKN